MKILSPLAPDKEESNEEVGGRESASATAMMDIPPVPSNRGSACHHMAQDFCKGYNKG